MTRPARMYLIHQYSRDIAVPSGSILMSTGCYLVQTDDGRNILIDSGMPPDADGSDPPTEESAGILAQLRELGVRPEDVEVVICTHFDIDHVGHHEHFINAEHIVQREQYEVAVSGAERFASGRSHWDAPGAQRRLVDGDVELMPGLRLLETSGHAPGHQSVLVTLPGTDRMEELRKRMRGGEPLVVIDVRATEEFDAGHPGGQIDSARRARKEAPRATSQARDRCLLPRPLLRLRA